jgi:FdhD protein
VKVDFKKLSRNVYATSSCGLCGKASIEAVHQAFAPIETAATISARLVARLPRRMQAAQKHFARTGGVHAAAIFDDAGRLLVLREDVGRHNAVDKVIGFGLLARLDFNRSLLLVSGRASFEIVQKALAGRIGIIAAISAPSSLAVEFARESGQTLIGFLRGDKMNLYSHTERVKA